MQRVAREFATQAHVFELVALEHAVETQVAAEFGTGPQDWLVGAEEGGHLDRDFLAVMHRAGAQLDAFRGDLAAGLFIVELDPGVVHGQAVDVQADRLRGFVFRLGAGRFGGLVGLRGDAGTGGRAADVLPVAVAVLVAGKPQVEAFDADIAHLHFAAQQRQDAHRQAEHLQVGKRLGRGDQGRDAGIVQLQAQPGEKAPADVAIEGQLNVGLVAGNLANLVFIVVGIEQVGQGKACRHDDQQQPEKPQTQDFAERFHGRVLVVSGI